MDQCTYEKSMNLSWPFSRAPEKSRSNALYARLLTGKTVKSREGCCTSGVSTASASVEPEATPLVFTLGPCREGPGLSTGGSSICVRYGAIFAGSGSTRTTCRRREVSFRCARSYPEGRPLGYQRNAYALKMGRFN